MHMNQGIKVSLFLSSLWTYLYIIQIFIFELVDGNMCCLQCYGIVDKNHEPECENMAEHALSFPLGKN